MASDDQTNPYARPSHWPTLPTGTMRLGPLPKVAAPQPEAAPASERVREPVRFEPEAVEPAPQAPPATDAEPYPFFGPTSRSTHPALSPTEALLRTPTAAAEPEPPSPPPAPERRVEAASGDIGKFGDLDLAIPTPADETLVVPIAARRAGARGRKSSPMVPILAASAVGVVGVGVLVLLMTAGRQAAAPPAAVLAPPPPPAASAPDVPAVSAVEASPPAAPAARPAAAAKPAPQRLAAAVRGSAAPPRAAAVAPQPYVLDIPPPDPEPTRITIPPPAAAAPAPAPPVAPRTPPPGPDQPMATHPPD